MILRHEISCLSVHRTRHFVRNLAATDEDKTRGGGITGHTITLATTRICVCRRLGGVRKEGKRRERNNKRQKSTHIYARKQRPGNITKHCKITFQLKFCSLMSFSTACCVGVRPSSSTWPIDARSTISWVSKKRPKQEWGGGGYVGVTSHGSCLDRYNEYTMNTPTPHTHGNDNINDRALRWNKFMIRILISEPCDKMDAIYMVEGGGGLPMTGKKKKKRKKKGGGTK